MDSKFKPVAETRKYRLLMKAAVSDQARCVWHFRGKEKLYHSRILDFHVARRHLTLTVPEGNSGDDLVAISSQSGHCLVTIFLKTHGVVCFQAEYFVYEGGDLKIKVPETIFEIQRRKDLRIPFSAGYDVEVEYDNPIREGERIRRRLLDISPEGLSFQVAEDATPAYEKGATLLNFSVTVRQRTITTDVRIHHVSKLDARTFGQGYRVGASFVELSAEDSEFLSRYIAEQAVMGFIPDFEGIVIEK